MATEAQLKLEERRQRLVANADELMDVARQEERTLSEEEARQFDKIHEDVEKLTADIKRSIQQDEVQRQMQEMRSPERVPGIATDRPTMSIEQLVLQDEDNFRSFMLTGKMKDGSTPATSMLESLGEVPVLRSAMATREERRKELERRALTATLFTGTDQMGGAVPGSGESADSRGSFLTSETMAAAIEIALRAYNGFREAPTMKMATANGEPIQWPMVDDTNITGTRLGQATDAPVRQPSFQNKTLQAWTYSSNMVPVTRQLLQDSRYDVPALLGELLGTRLGRIQGLEATRGVDGTSGPESVVDFLVGLAANAGRGARQNVTLVSGAVPEIAYENMIDLEMSIDAAYRMGGSTGWMFNSKTLGDIKKIADSQNRPLWLPGNIAGGNPATIFGYPYWINEHMAGYPIAATADVVFMLFGDMSKVILRDSLDIMLQRLDERYAESFQVAFLGWARYDVRVLDAGTHPLKYMSSQA